MGRLTNKFENYCFTVCKIFPTSGFLGDCKHLENCYERTIYDKLQHYETLEEQGRLIELPCAVGDTVWTYWIDDEESGVMADVPMSERECVVIRSLWGKDYFATREEAVRKLEELKGE